MTAGGGGWGDPLERDPEHVRLDVLRRFVSLEKAREEYGVVLDASPVSVDAGATEALRQELRAMRTEEPDLFHFGDAPAVVPTRA